MQRFLIKYTYQPESGSVEEWHRHIAEFISALDNDPVLKGRITYRCMKVKDSSSYYHLAEPVDDAVPSELAQREFFKRYTAQTKLAGGGSVEVLALETIAETKG